MCDIFKDPRFNFGAEGSMASGYELYTSNDTAEEIIQEIKANVKLNGHKIELYSRTREIEDGTRYDRLIDHFDGEDPERPSVNGIRFDL